MILASWFKFLALLALCVLDLLTCIENPGPKAPEKAQKTYDHSASNNNNSNISISGSKPVIESFSLVPKYLVSNTGKLPPENKKHPHPRLRPNKHSSHRSREVEPTHSRRSHSTHQPTHEFKYHDNGMISLNISEKNNTHGYTITRGPNKVIFQATNSRLFREVKHGTQTLWQYKGRGYPNKVIYREVDGKPKVDVFFPEEAQSHEHRHRPPNFISTQESDSSRETIRSHREAPATIGPHREAPETIRSQREAPSTAPLHPFAPPPATATPSTMPYTLHVPLNQPAVPSPGANVLELDITTENGAVVMRPKLYQGGKVSDDFLITVNIDKLETTEKVHYSYDPTTDIHTLKAKDPYLINKVVRNNEVIWTPKNNKYGDRIIIKYEGGRPRAKILHPDWITLNLPPPKSTFSDIRVVTSQPSAATPEIKIQAAQPPTQAPVQEQQAAQAESKSATDVLQRLHAASKTQPTKPVAVTPQTVTPTATKPVTETPQPVTPTATKPVTETPQPVTPTETKPAKAATAEIPSTVDTNFKPPKIVPKDVEPEKKIPVELDLNIKRSTDQFEYSTDTTKKAVTYNAKGLNRFSSVKYGTNKFWSSSKPEEYANKVVLTSYQHPGMFDLFINFDDRSSKSFYKDSSAPWTPIDTSKVNGLSLNILSKFDSFYYTVEITGKYKTFIAKNGFKFYKIRSGEKEIWKTDKTEEYSSKVVSENDKKVVVHMDNQQIKTLSYKCTGCHGCKGFWCGLFTCGLYNCCAKRWREIKTK